MGCLENYDWTVKKPQKELYEQVKACWDRVAKPLDGMGRFEELLAQIGAIQHTTNVRWKKKALLIYCADNGIVEEGVSQSGQEVTRAVMKNMAEKRSSVCRMAQVACVDVIPVDIGVCSNERVTGVRWKNVRKGTRNFRKEAAMTKEEVLQAIEIGMELVRDCKESGYDLIGVGEMGIGNTTTSSAIAAALLQCPVEDVTGRGAGLTDEKLEKKRRVIEEALERYQLREAEPLWILQTVGGFDLAALVGTYLGGARYHVPIVLDGVISLAAALLAERLVPGVSAYLIASHKGKEPASEKLLQALHLFAVIDGNLALGEGTGAVMMMSLLDLALSVYEESATFADIALDSYERYV